MSNNKQSSVDWLAEIIRFANKELYAEMFDQIEQAKARHKEEMDKVAGDFWNEGASYVSDGQRKYNSFEQYYNETYNK